MKPCQQLPPLSYGNIPLVDFHLHTNWTDGAKSVKEMHDQAIRLGLSTILFSEHVRKTSEEWFPDFAHEVRSLPQDVCRTLVGVETKVIDYSGTIDCADSVIQNADIIIASVHRFPDDTTGKIQEFAQVDPRNAVEMEYLLSCAILSNPVVDVLGHPFGMCFRRYNVAPPRDKIVSLIKMAAKENKAFEINSRYHSDPWALVNLCQELGAPISLGSDAHDVSGVGEIIRVLNGGDPTWKKSES